MTDRGTEAEAVLLAAWLGAVLFFAAIVAPAAFEVLPERASAGALVGRTLPALFVAGMAAGAFVTIRAVLKRSGAARTLAGGVLVLGCAVSHLVIGARITTLRQAIGPSLDALAQADPRRAMFGRLHALSVAGLGVATVAAVIALWLAFAALRRQSRIPEFHS